MGKKGHQPSKPKPQFQKRGNQNHASQFRSQLEALGLKIVEVIADGNCFFRCLADQLDGNEEEHGKYRAMVVDYIKKNRSSFEPFIEDDAPFDEYCFNMAKDGNWAGNMELQAASLATRSNICIHQFKSPRWYIRNFEEKGTFMIHISYHDEEHYNSVRMKDDPCDGPSRPISIEADAGTVPPTALRKNGAETASLKVVMAGSGCGNARKAEDVLLQVHGDVDAAIEYLIAEQQTEDNDDTNNDNELENGEVPVLEMAANLADDLKEKDVAKGKVTNFGAKKTRSSSIQINNVKKGGKGKKMSKRVHLDSHVSSKPLSAFPDVGALHI